MGRAPCCDKANVKKGPWSPEEDAKLKSYIDEHGTGGNWIALPQKIGLKRCGKSCRLRWLNYLRPNLKHGGFSEQEDNIICSLYISIGSRWSVIAAQLPGRTDNDIKNYWNTRLKKKLFGKHRNKEARNRGNGGVKQESNNREGVEYPLSLVHENSTHQQPYLPHIPVLSPLPPPLQYTTNQGPSFNDQDSIRKLLIKLGGRFSNEYPYPTSDGSTQQDFQEKVHLGSSACIDNNEVVQFGQYLPPQGGVGVLDMVQREGSFTPTIEAMVSSNSPQRLDGLEFFYGEEMINEKIIGTSTSCSQSTSWGHETCTPMYHSLPLNFQG